MKSLTGHRDVGPVKRILRSISGTKPMTWLLTRTLHHADRYIFSYTKGRHTASNLLTGLPVVMLTTIGAKSGRKRTIPLLGIPDGRNIIVVASGYGQTKYPAWYHNLRAHPDAEAEVHGERNPVKAREVEGEERERLWRLCLEVYPAFAAYGERAGGRRIPVIVLETV